MNALLTLLYLLLGVAIVIFVPPLVAPYAAEHGVVTGFDIAKAILLCTSLAALAGFYSYKSDIDGKFLLRLFVAALLVRMALGTAIFVFHGQEFFGGDAVTYDSFGLAQLQGWWGDKSSLAIANRFVLAGEDYGRGLVYLVAAVYALVGPTMLAVQFLNSVLGAPTSLALHLSW